MDLVFFTTVEEKYKHALDVIGPATRVEPQLKELPALQGLSQQKILEHKAKVAFDMCHKLVMVEDTSLYVTAWSGLPGPMIKWFVDYDIALLPKMVAGFPRVAECRSTVALLAPGFSEPQFFTSSLSGTIVDPVGENGFGFDPIFKPDDSAKTFAELTYDEKIKISPRSDVFKQVYNLFMDDRKCTLLLGSPVEHPTTHEPAIDEETEKTARLHVKDYKYEDSEDLKVNTAKCEIHEDPKDSKANTSKCEIQLN